MRVFLVSVRTGTPRFAAQFMRRTNHVGSRVYSTRQNKPLSRLIKFVGMSLLRGSVWNDAGIITLSVAIKGESASRM